jgi:hypothetical protein
MVILKMEEKFTTIYKKNAWGNGSGGGSTIEFNKNTYNKFLVDFIKENNIKSVTDAACGDWQSSYLIYDELEGVEYNGYDVVKFLIDENREKHPKYNFHHLDFFENPEGLKDADLIILKDVLQHWSSKQVVYFLDRILTRFKYILICNTCNQTRDYELNDSPEIPLSCKFFPLNKYGAKEVYKYGDKEVSIIQYK